MERSHQRGFTLFELMVSIMILALLVGLAVPTFRTITANSRTSAATNNLASALAVARSEALRQSTTVSICPSGNQQTCDVSVTPDWTNGWIAFTDVNADGALGAGDTLIQAWPSAGPTMTVSSAAPFLQYNPRGMMNLGGSQTLTIAASGCRGNHKSQVVVTVVGSVQQSYVACP
jgi:type IV fimbrial biogenesis protein FimT